MHNRTTCLLSMIAFPRAAFAQQAGVVTAPQVHESSKSYTGPIFDVHLHTDPPASAIGVPNPVTGMAAAANAQALRDAVIQACKNYHITHAVLNGWPGTLQQWAESDSKRFILAPMVLDNDRIPVMSASNLRSEIENGRAGAVGEIMSQYAGLEPSDPILEPYWALAEAMDVPVMIHTGTSFPGTPSRVSQLPSPARQSIVIGGCLDQTSQTAALDCARRAAMVGRDFRLDGSISPGLYGCFNSSSACPRIQGMKLRGTGLSPRQTYRRSHDVVFAGFTHRKAAAEIRVGLAGRGVRCGEGRWPDKPRLAVVG